MNPLTNVKNITKLNERESRLGISEKASWHNEYRDSAWIFVGGLQHELTEGDIICVFSQYGEIININLIRDKKNGNSKGYGFVCYEDQRSTTLAVDNLNGIKLCGRVIRVDHVHDYKPPKDSEDLSEEMRKLIWEGVAPKTPSPSPPPKPVKKVKKEKKEKKRKDKRKSKLKEKKEKEQIKLKLKPKKERKDRSDTESSSSSSESSSSSSSSESDSSSESEKDKRRKKKKQISKKKREKTKASSKAKDRKQDRKIYKRSADEMRYSTDRIVKKKKNAEYKKSSYGYKDDMRAVDVAYSKRDDRSRSPVHRRHSEERREVPPPRRYEDYPEHNTDYYNRESRASYSQRYDDYHTSYKSSDGDYRQKFRSDYDWDRGKLNDRDPQWDRYDRDIRSKHDNYEWENDRYASKDRGYDMSRGASNYEWKDHRGGYRGSMYRGRGNRARSGYKVSYGREWEPYDDSYAEKEQSYRDYGRDAPAYRDDYQRDKVRYRSIERYPEEYKEERYRTQPRKYKEPEEYSARYQEYDMRPSRREYEYDTRTSRRDTEVKKTRTEEERHVSRYEERELPKAYAKVPRKIPQPKYADKRETEPPKEKREDNKEKERRTKDKIDDKTSQDKREPSKNQTEEKTEQK